MPSINFIVYSLLMLKTTALLILVVLQLSFISS
jgi:hypothetical protein